MREKKFSVPALLPLEPEMVLIPAGEFLMGSDPVKDKNAFDRAEVDKILGVPEELRPAALVFLAACDVSDETRRRARARCGNEMACDPGDADVHWGRGLAYRQLGNAKAALADFQRYLELRPDADNREMFEEWIAELEAEISEA